MTSFARAPRLDLDDAVFAENYDRVPFGFSHNLHRLTLFETESLRSLCEMYATRPQDYFVACSAPAAGAASTSGLFRCEIAGIRLRKSLKAIRLWIPCTATLSCPLYPEDIRFRSK